MTSLDVAAVGMLLQLLESGGEPVALAAAARAVAALAEEEENAPALLKTRVTRVLASVLQSESATAEAKSACAEALGALSRFEGTWRVSPAHREKEFSSAVAGAAALASGAPGPWRAAAAAALGQVLSGKSGASLDAATANAAVKALSFLLHPAGAASAEEEAAALQALSAGSANPGLLSSMRVSPTPELVMAAISSDSVQQGPAAAGIAFLARLARLSEVLLLPHTHSTCYSPIAAR